MAIRLSTVTVSILFQGPKNGLWDTPLKFNRLPLKNDGGKTIQSFWDGDLLNFGAVKFPLHPPVGSEILAPKEHQKQTCPADPKFEQTKRRV